MRDQVSLSYIRISHISLVYFNICIVYKDGKTNYSKLSDEFNLLLICRIWGFHSGGYKAFHQLNRWFAELFFDPEDGGDKFLRNVGCNSTDYTASYPRRWYSAVNLFVNRNFDLRLSSAAFELFTFWSICHDLSCSLVTSHQLICIFFSAFTFRQTFSLESNIVSTFLFTCVVFMFGSNRVMPSA
jgi:hypothetical protein